MHRRESLGYFVRLIAFPSLIGQLFRRRSRVENRQLTLCHEIEGWDFVNCEITGDASGHAALRNCTLIDSPIYATSSNPVRVIGCRMTLTKAQLKPAYERVA